MRPRAVEARRVRLGFRTLASLALCAAAAGAAMAHFAIDFLGDYALRRDSYDHLRHDSRELLTGIAVLAALILASRGLRICCEIVALNRARVVHPVLRFRDALGILGGAVTASLLIVPAMEYLDGRLDGTPVHRLAEAFGGSILLGLGTTLVCAAFVALAVYAVARWLVSHRDAIVTIIETLLRAVTGPVRPSARHHYAQRVTPRRRRTANALRLAKRGPPAGSFA
jgi:hypothetical protein